MAEKGQKSPKPKGWRDLKRQNLPKIVSDIDFARKRHLSVAWTNERVGDVLQTREVLEMHDMSTPDQVDLLRPRIEKCQRVCLDYTGPGVGMGDYLVKEFGEYDPKAHKNGKIELVTFLQNTKVDLFSKQRMAFEAKLVRVPISRVIREGLHSVHRVTSNNGGVTYRAPQTEDGHADRCTAHALSVRAGEGDPRETGGYEAIENMQPEYRRIGGGL